MIRSVPIYDYRCDECGHVFSAVRSFTEADVDSCPNCGKRPRKLITAPAVVFKGGGWYKTDSRGKAPKEDGGSSPASPKEDVGSRPASPKEDGGSSPASPKEGESSSSGARRGESRPAAKESKGEAKETKADAGATGKQPSGEAKS